MSGALVFQPLLPWPVLLPALVLLLAPVALAALARRWRMAAARLLVAATLALVLLQPARRIEERQPQADIAVAVLDTSGSMAVDGRGAQARAALAALRAGSPPGLRWRVVEAGDKTRLGEALTRAIGQAPAERLAGAVVVSDGIVTLDAPPALPPGRPLHVLLAGDPAMIDRRLSVVAAAPYAVVGGRAGVVLSAEGVPAGTAVDWSIDGQTQPPATVGGDGRVRLAVPVARRGPIAIAAGVPPAAREPVIANNAVLTHVNGVRERLSVLLISGAPSLSTRSWRDILTADAALETVHFTILRLPTSFDPTPTHELSLIPFPVEQLFEQRLGRFDLIVMDRFDQLDLLAPQYFTAIADYVRKGGALLVVPGRDFTRPTGLFNTALGPMLPARPTADWSGALTRPSLTAVGARHPVTATLPAAWGGRRDWGRWSGHLPARAIRGDTVLATGDGAPLLVLDRQARGRLGLLLSSDVWAWGRGVEGGGPRDVLLGRLVHWLMQEPDLEEESLAVAAGTDRLMVTARALASAAPLRVTTPAGRTSTLPLTPDAQGVARLGVTAPAPGLYRVERGDLRRFALVGADAERQEVRPRTRPLDGLARASGGGTFWLKDGVPAVRRTARGDRQAGGGWLGLVGNNSGALLGVREAPVVPALLLWALVAASLGLAWVSERR